MNRLAALLTVLAAPVLADDPFDCVDPVFLDAFLGHWGQQQSTYSTAVPPEFPPLVLPEELDLVGSQVSAVFMRVAFESSEPRSEVVAKTLTALEMDGWKQVDQQRGMPRGGFTMSSQPVSRLVCRDSKPGTMNLTAREVAGRSILTLSIHGQQSRQSCADLEEQRRPGHAGPLMELMPSLSLPPDAETTNVGMGGSGDEMSSRVVVSTTKSRQGLLEFLGNQIREQDWVADSAWSGNVSSGSVWSLSSADHGLFVGVLRITQASSDVFNVRFSISPVGSDQGLFAAGSFSSFPP